MSSHRNIGVFSALEEKVGFPYNVILAEMMSRGSGGGFGIASLCGSTTGSAYQEQESPWIIHNKTCYYPVNRNEAFEIFVRREGE